MSDAKVKKETIQKGEISRRTTQNSELTKDLNQLKEQMTELKNSKKKLEMDNAILREKLENYKKQDEEQKKNKAELPGLGKKEPSMISESSGGLQVQLEKKSKQTHI